MDPRAGLDVVAKSKILSCRELKLFYNRHGLGVESSYPIAVV
jgi:hypothetical protein